MAVFVVALCLGAAAACVPGQAIYDKPGLTYSEWKDDDAECREAASSGAASGLSERDAYARCMASRGYKIRSR